MRVAESRKIAEYDLYPHQARLLELAASHPIVCLEGGVRNGKTRAAVAWVLDQMGWFGRACPPRSIPRVGWIVVPVMQGMWDNIRPEWEGMLGFSEDGGLILEKRESPVPKYVVRAPDGGAPWEIYVKSAEHPDRLRAATIRFVWITEAAMMDEPTYMIVQQRVLASKGSVCLESSPFGLNWFHKRIIERASYLEDWAPYPAPPISFTRNEGDSRIAVVMGVPIDANESLDRQAIADMRKDYSADEAKRELDGRFFAWAGLVWRNFSLQRNTCDPPKPEALDGWTFIAGLDFGFGHPTAHVWVAKKDGNYMVVDEYRESGLTMKDHVFNIKARSWNKRVSDRYHDPSGAQAAKDCWDLGLGSSEANNDLELGVDCIATLFESGRLVISKACAKLLDEIGNYHRDERTGKIVKLHDDLACALRYAIFTDVSHGGGVPLPHASLSPLSGKMEVDADTEEGLQIYEAMLEASDEMIARDGVDHVTMESDESVGVREVI